MENDVRLFNCVTEHDRRESTKRGYNPYALGHYAKGLSDVRERILRGMSTRQALVVSFSGRLLDKMLKSIGEPRYERDEEMGLAGKGTDAPEHKNLQQ